MNNDVFNYLIKDDYDSSYKIENKKLKCYSKKKFEEITKDKKVKVIGETLLRNKKKEISSIKLNSNTFIISKYKEHSSLFYKKAGYVEVKTNEYLCLLEFRAFIIWIIILALLLGCFFGVRGIIAYNNRGSSIIAPDFDKTDVDDNQVPDKDADEEVKVVIPEGTVSSEHVVNTSDGKKYTGDANVNLYVTVEGGAKVLLSQKVKLNDGKFPEMKIDFTTLTFELKPGIYDGKIVVSFDDGTKDETKIKVIIVEKTGGTTGIGYSDKVNINLNTGNISLKYKLGKSSHDVILQLILDKDGKEDLLSESGIIKPDSEITKMSLRNYMKSKLTKGTYKGEIALNKFSTSGEVKLGTYTVTIGKGMVTAEGEKVANLSYTGTAEKGGKITIGGKQFTVLSNADGVIRAMSDENLGITTFSSINYWADDYNNGTLHRNDLIDLNNPANNIRPMLDTYAETLGIDKTSVTLPTYAELNALTEEQRRTSGFGYWSRSLRDRDPSVYLVGSSGFISYDAYYGYGGVRPVVILAAE